MKNSVIIGSVLILCGVGLLIYYLQFSMPENEAGKLLVEGTMAYEIGTRESINQSINIFTKVIAQYPGTKASLDAHYHIAQSYEKLGLNAQAYLKYIYFLKNNSNLSPEMFRNIKTRIAGLMVLKRYSDEGIFQLMELLGTSHDRDFRSRVYTELGHAYLKMGDYSKSRTMFDIAITEKGNNEEAVLGKARACWRMGQEEKSYDLYEYFFKYFSHFSSYTKDVENSYISQVFTSGYSSYRKAEYQRAIAFFQRICTHFPGHMRTENALYWIAECHYMLKNYETAGAFFERVLRNGYTHKDEDARIKKGVTFFMAKKFDLAAREFQLYINEYPSGKHIATAKEWKNMSTREILNRIKDTTDSETEEDENPVEKSRDKKYREIPKKEENKNNPASGKTDSDNLPDESKLDNVAEL